MTFEQVVKRYQHRDGFRLADATEIGLPVYAINVQAVTLAHKRVAPIEEFIMRCVSMQLSSVEEIGDYLGLSPEVIKPALANLAQTENIALTAKHGRQSWTLTSKGASTLSTSSLVVPEERTFSLHFDAVLRRLAFLKYHKLLKYKDMKEQGLVEIEVFPPRRPQIDEIQPAELERIMRIAPAQHEQRRDVLAIRAVDQRSTKKLYLPAIGLLFKGTEGEESQLAFIIDGKDSKEHEIAFAGNDGFVRVMQAMGASIDERVAVTALAGEEGKLVPSPQLEELKSATVLIECQVAQTQQIMASANDPEKEALRAQLQQAQRELERLREEAARYEVRNLYVMDHPPLLQDAIANSKDRLLLISPWVRSKVVTRNFLEKLEDLLRKQVKVYVGYGISPQDTANLSTADERAIVKLKMLAQQYPNFQLKRLGNTHAKVLIKDQEFAVITSFNWLSFKGDPLRTFRDEQGILISKPESVDSKFAELVGRF